MLLDNQQLTQRDMAGVDVQTKRGSIPLEVPDHLESNTENEGRKGRRQSKRSSVYKRPDIEPDNPDNGRPVTPWEAFESHVKNIGDDSTVLFSGTGSKIKFKMSNEFGLVMEEVNAKRRQQELKKLERLRQLERERAEREAAAAEAEQEPEEDEEEEEEEDDDDFSSPEPEVPRAVRLHAQRGWGLIKGKIQEMHMEKKNNAAMFHWKILKQTMSSMSDMEKARKDLYDRYLYNNDEFMGHLKLKDKDGLPFGQRRHGPTRVKSAQTDRREKKVISPASSRKSLPNKPNRKNVKKTR